MARITSYSKGDVSLLDNLIGTDLENSNATVNMPVASIIDLAVQYFATNGGGDAINQSLFDVTSSVDSLSTTVASYTDSINTITSDNAAIASRMTTIEAVFTTEGDGSLSISSSKINNFQESIASAGFATATSVTSLTSSVQGISDDLSTNYSTTTATEGLITTATTDMASATKLTNLSSSLGTVDETGALVSISDSIATQVLSTENTEQFARASFVTNLASTFGTTDSAGNLTINAAFANSVMNTETTTNYAAASRVDTLEATVGDAGSGLVASVNSNSDVIADIDGYVQARHTIQVGAGGAFAGMSLLASDGTTEDALSEIRFAADKFKIYNGGQDTLDTSYDAPFEVVGGVVKIKSANIGTVSFGDLANVPATLQLLLYMQMTRAVQMHLLQKEHARTLRFTMVHGQTATASQVLRLIR